MMRSKIIQDDALLQIYVSHYLKLAHNHVDINYLKQAKVRIFYQTVPEDMLAGFCINSSVPFRTFLPISDEQLRKLRINNNINNDQLHEITCIWIDRNIRLNFWGGYRYYFTLLWDVLRLKSGTLIIGTHEKKLKDMYSPGFPQVIFYDNIFVATKTVFADFWIMKGSKYTFLTSLVSAAVSRILGRVKKWYRQQHSQ
ncbi:hypothetical protein [uncultured Shewanella sp.]|uniref:hypothetical protein n=1 Tax=uncultured Shewanella sp. TaxID=173975 RepID=UPI0026201240|nr:hypothetical protein [uncultured Shewanella sp.]